MLSPLDITTLLKMYSSLSVPDLVKVITDDIASGKANYRYTQQLKSADTKTMTG